MGNEIVRYDDDTYVAWNTTCDAPEVWDVGFDEMVEYLVKYDKMKEEYARPEAVARLERARDVGTSQMWHQHKGDDEVYIFEQTGWLRLSDMKAFLATWDGSEFDTSLLQPFED